MFMIDCYSTELTYQEYLELSDDEIKDKCTFEYSIEVTCEAFIAVRGRKVCYIPIGFTNNVEHVKAFYFCKNIVNEGTSKHEGKTKS